MTAINNIKLNGETMKKKQLNKKLIFNKSTVSNLSDNKMSLINGRGPSGTDACQTDTCITLTCENTCLATCGPTCPYVNTCAESCNGLTCATCTLCPPVCW